MGDRSEDAAIESGERPESFSQEISTNDNGVLQQMRPGETPSVLPVLEISDTGAPAPEATSSQPERRPEPGNPVRRTLEDGSTETRAVDARGREVTVRSRADGTTIYYRDGSGEWTSENGRNWRSAGGSPWNGTISISDQGTVVHTSDQGTVTTMRHDGSRTVERRGGTYNERPTANGGTETGTRDSQGREVVLRSNAAGTMVYCRDQSGEWTSENGREWRNSQGRTWNGSIETHNNDGSIVYRGEHVVTRRLDGSTTTQRPSGAQVTERPIAGGGTETEVVPQGAPNGGFTVRTNREGTATYMRDSSGVWTSSDGRNWQRDNGQGRAPTPWTGSVTLTPNGCESRSSSGRIESRTYDGTRTVRYEGSELPTIYEPRVRTDDSGRFMVMGPDGVERQYVVSSERVQQPAEPTRFVAGVRVNGGAIQNNSERPLLVLGKGPGNDNNHHGDGHLRIVPPRATTNGEQTDYDGIVTDPRFQPVVLPDGRILMPAQIPASAQAEARWHKVPDAGTATVSQTGTISVERPLGGDHGPGRPMSEYVGNNPITPETQQMRNRSLQSRYQQSLPLHLRSF